MTEISVSNGPALIPLDIYKGDTITKTVTIREDGALADVSGDDFNMLFVDGRGNTLFSLGVSSGITYVSQGVIKINITAAQTAALEAGAKVKSDLRWVRDLDGRKKTLFKTIGKVIQSITP